MVPSFKARASILVLGSRGVSHVDWVAQRHVPGGHGSGFDGQVLLVGQLCLTSTDHNGLVSHRGGIAAARRMSNSFLLLIHL